VNNYEPRNHSFGHSNVNAAYVMGDIDLLKDLRFSGGIRVEATDIFTDVDKFYMLIRFAKVVRIHGYSLVGRY
ncbi:MAG: hypothetical protein ACKPKO_02070, partial [Candidatus Fonsibacter sp.]